MNDKKTEEGKPVDVCSIFIGAEKMCGVAHEMGWSPYSLDKSYASPHNQASAANFLAAKFGGIGSPSPLLPGPEQEKSARIETLEGMVRDLRVAVSPLALISDRWDANDLEDGARKFYGEHNEHQTSTDPGMIELYSGRGGERLLSLGQCLAARETVKRCESVEDGPEVVLVLRVKVETEGTGPRFVIGVDFPYEMGDDDTARILDLARRAVVGLLEGMKT